MSEFSFPPPLVTHGHDNVVTSSGGGGEAIRSPVLNCGEGRVEGGSDVVCTRGREGGTKDGKQQQEDKRYHSNGNLEGRKTKKAEMPHLDINSIFFSFDVYSTVHSRTCSAKQASFSGN